MDNGMLAQLTLRILMAAFLGGLIGLERSSGDRPAGLRTHVLVATGSALLMVVSIYGIDGHPQARDPSRIASQVVSGIGFLGAGTILHEGLTVKGLTTAASLWIVSAIGLTVGCGMLALGIFATGITLVTLILIRGLEKKVAPSREGHPLQPPCDRQQGSGQHDRGHGLSPGTEYQDPDPGHAERSPAKCAGSGPGGENRQILQCQRNHQRAEEYQGGAESRLAG